MTKWRLSTLIAVAMIGWTQLSAGADEWPQWMGERRDGVWRESGILEKFPQGGPRVRWRVAVGAGYSSPAVAGGRVYVHDRKVRVVPASRPDPFKRISTPGVERLICLNETDGKEVWKQEYPCDYTMSYNSGPRAAPLVEGEKVYTFGGEGDLQCRRISDGRLIWEKHLGGERTPMWGFSSSPLIEGNKLIVFGSEPDAMVMAFAKDTGKLIWKAIPAKEPGYSSPIIIEAGGKRQLIVWNPKSLHSLDPETGKEYWSEPVESRSGMSVATPRRERDLLFVTSFFSGAMMMQLDSTKPAAKRLWKISGRSERNTEAIHSTISTPVIRDGYIYGVDSYGQFRCLKARTGERIWETFAPTTGGAGRTRWANAFINAHEDRYFLFNESGDLIIARLEPNGYGEICRAHLIEPDNMDANRPVVWCQPAYANKSIYVRNDKEIVCASLAK